MKKVFVFIAFLTLLDCGMAYGADNAPITPAQTDKLCSAFMEIGRLGEGIHETKINPSLLTLVANYYKNVFENSDAVDPNVIQNDIESCFAKRNVQNTGMGFYRIGEKTVIASGMAHILSRYAGRAMLEEESAQRELDERKRREENARLYAQRKEEEKRLDEQKRAEEKRLAEQKREEERKQAEERMKLEEERKERAMREAEASSSPGESRGPKIFGLQLGMSLKEASGVVSNLCRRFNQPVNAKDPQSKRSGCWLVVGVDWQNDKNCVNKFTLYKVNFGYDYYKDGVFDQDFLRKFMDKYNIPELNPKNVNGHEAYVYSDNKNGWKIMIDPNYVELEERQKLSQINLE